MAGDDVEMFAGMDQDGNDQLPGLGKADGKNTARL